MGQQRLGWTLLEWGLWTRITSDRVFLRVMFCALGVISVLST